MPPPPRKTTLLVPFLNSGNKEWLQECLDSFPDIPYVVAGNDGEMAEALNAALETIDTEFTMVFGADDVILPGALEMLESLIWDVDVTYPSMILTDEELEPFGEFPAFPFCGNRLQHWNFVSGAFLARTESLKKIGGWRDLETLEDWDLHVRNYRAGARFKPVPEAKILYRRSKGSRNQVDEDFNPDDWRKRIVGEAPKTEATFYYGSTPVTTYWRCQVPSRHLPAKCQDDVVLHMSEEDATLPEHSGTAIFQFPGDATRAAFMQVVMPSLGVRVLLETDDNYTVSMPFRKRQGWDKTIADGPHSFEGHKVIAEAVDGIIVTTETLANVYGKLNPNIYICPNSIDPDDWPELEKPEDGIFRVGWFASRSHAGDSHLIKRAMEWASKQPDVEVVTMGFDPMWRFPRKHIPWTNDLSVYWKMMMQLDVGLSPIVPNPWSICRSDLKALEYSMAGVCSVLQDAPPYSGWELSLKATKPLDYLRAVQTLVSDKEAARRLAMDARAYVLGERTIKANIHRWREACESSPA